MTTQRNIKHSKQLIITKEELQKCEDQFMEEYLQKKLMQKQLIRQVTSGASPSSTMLLDNSFIGGSSHHLLVPTAAASAQQLQVVSNSLGSLNHQPPMKRNTP